MRKDDPSSRRPRRRKSAAVAPSLALAQEGAAEAPRPSRKARSASLDCDFGLALCLLQPLRGKRPADA